MCKLVLHRIIEVGSDPFDTDLLVVNAASFGVLGRTESLDEEVGSVGEPEDGHFGFCLFGWGRMV